MKKFITSKSDIMGGAPCIIGTRIPIEVILYRIRDGYSLKELYKMYPWVTKGKFEGALEEVARGIGRDQDDQEISQTQATA